MLLAGKVFALEEHRLQKQCNMLLFFATAMRQSRSAGCRRGCSQGVCRRMLHALHDARSIGVTLLRAGLPTRTSAPAGGAPEGSAAAAPKGSGPICLYPNPMVATANTYLLSDAPVRCLHCVLLPLAQASVKLCLVW